MESLITISRCHIRALVLTFNDRRLRGLVAQVKFHELLLEAVIFIAGARCALAIK